MRSKQYGYLIAACVSLLVISCGAGATPSVQSSPSPNDSPATTRVVPSPASNAPGPNTNAMPADPDFPSIAASLDGSSTPDTRIAAHIDEDTAFWRLHGDGQGTTVEWCCTIDTVEDLFAFSDLVVHGRVRTVSGGPTKLDRVKATGEPTFDERLNFSFLSIDVMHSAGVPVGDEVVIDLFRSAEITLEEAQKATPKGEYLFFLKKVEAPDPGWSDFACLRGHQCVYADGGELWNPQWNYQVRTEAGDDPTGDYATLMREYGETVGSRSDPSDR